MNAYLVDMKVPNVLLHGHLYLHWGLMLVLTSRGRRCRMSSAAFGCDGNPHSVNGVILVAAVNLLRRRHLREKGWTMRI